MTRSTGEQVSIVLTRKQADGLLALLKIWGEPKEGTQHAAMLAVIRASVELPDEPACVSCLRPVCRLKGCAHWSEVGQGLCSSCWDDESDAKDREERARMADATGMSAAEREYLG